MGIYKGKEINGTIIAGEQTFAVNSYGFVCIQTLTLKLGKVRVRVRVDVWATSEG